MNWNFYERIKEHMDEELVIREGLDNEGAGLIIEILDLPKAETSLRQLAKDVGCSATYLSRIMNGKLICSPRLYVALSDLLRNRTRVIGLTGRKKPRHEAM